METYFLRPDSRVGFLLLASTVMRVSSPWKQRVTFLVLKHTVCSKSPACRATPQVRWEFADRLQTLLLVEKADDATNTINWVMSPLERIVTLLKLDTTHSQAENREAETCWTGYSRKRTLQRFSETTLCRTLV